MLGYSIFKTKWERGHIPSVWVVSYLASYKLFCSEIDFLLTAASFHSFIPILLGVYIWLWSDNLIWFLKHRFAILQSTQFSCLCSTVWIYELYLACATFWFKTCLLHCICLSLFFHSCLSFVREYIRKRKRVRVGCGLWSYLREIQQELEADRCSCGITTGDKALAGWPGVVPGGQLGYLIVLVHAFTIQNDNRFFLGLKNRNWSYTL